jgi:hypothetical protein
MVMLLLAEGLAGEWGVVSSCPVCELCRGSGQYVGFTVVESCLDCGGAVPGDIPSGAYFLGQSG